MKILSQKFSGEISTNWPNNLFETNVMTPEFCYQLLLTILQWTQQFSNEANFHHFQF